MKNIKIFMLLLIIIVVFNGCKAKDNKSSVFPEKTIKPEKIAQTIEPSESSNKLQAKSKLTGLSIDQDLVNKRPYAIMLNNIKYASPHSGISEAGILYEALVEGGITRLMGIFEDFSSDRIGSIRSARHYFVSFADEYDSIFVHFGQTKYAVSKMSVLGTDNLSGLEGVGTTVFYRDNQVRAPHNAFTGYDKILLGTKEKNYETAQKEDYENHYAFYKQDTKLSSDIKAGKVTLGYSNYTTPYFEYNQEDKLYYRYQFDKAHIDKNTGEQLNFKNVIVQFVKEWDIDKNGYQTMDIENSAGTGYYITNGNAVNITWQKNESTKKMHYYDMDGNILTVNSGKTYIAIFPNHRADNVVLTD